MIFGSYMFWRIVLNGFKGRIEWTMNYY
jgi:hypothetical protein